MPYFGAEWSIRAEAEEVLKQKPKKKVSKL